MVTPTSASNKHFLTTSLTIKKPQGYTHDWNGLIELLDNVDLETLAKNVKHALLCIDTRI